MKLTMGTGPDGTVAQIGQIVIDWVCVVVYLFRYDEFQHATQF